MITLYTYACRSVRIKSHKFYYMTIRKIYRFNFAKNILHEHARIGISKSSFKSSCFMQKLESTHAYMRSILRTAESTKPLNRLCYLEILHQFLNDIVEHVKNRYN